jgi:hypothetical protein
MRLPYKWVIGWLNTLRWHFGDTFHYLTVYFYSLSPACAIFSISSDLYRAVSPVSLSSVTLIAPSALRALVALVVTVALFASAPFATVAISP